MPTHVTLSGHTIEYEETPSLRAFLERLQEIAKEPSKTADEFRTLMYSKENPLLDSSIFAEQGAVTKEALANPAYRVMSDLLFRKEVQQRGDDVEKIAAQFTVPVPEAARRLGMTEGGVRQAIAARRLSSWVKEGRYFTSEHAIENFERGNRGPRPAMELEVCLGRTTGRSFRMKAPTDLVQVERHDHVIAGRLPRWERIAFISGHGEKYQMSVLEPDPEGDTEIRFGPFYVRGPFKIAERFNSAEKAREAFKVFEPR
jgi:hypothetical protein